MSLDLTLDYETSIFNPLLKMIVIVLYMYATVAYVRGRRFYGGSLEKVIGILITAGGLGALAAVFRLVGGNFPHEVKWLESLGYIAQAGVFALAAHEFRNAIKRAASLREENQ